MSNSVYVSNNTKLKPEIERISFLNENDMKFLRRFYETSEDGEGYDIGQEAIHRLAELGCVQRTGYRKAYYITVFGLYVIGEYDKSLPLKTYRDMDRESNPHLIGK